jgi:hypothetical protein
MAKSDSKDKAWVVKITHSSIGSAHLDGAITFLIKEQTSVGQLFEFCYKPPVPLFENLQDQRTFGSGLLKIGGFENLQNSKNLQFQVCDENFWKKTKPLVLGFSENFQRTQ